MQEAQIENQDVVWKRINLALFLGLHLTMLLAIFTGVSAWSLALFAIFYVVRMFGVTGGYHRYFAHRTYKMGRVMQFIMAWLAMTNAQKGVLWWAGHHRHHHKHSDQEDDVHSPLRKGFWYSHMGWILDPRWEGTDMNMVKDLAKYPELVWLNRHNLLPVFSLGFATFGVAWAVSGDIMVGWEAAVVGFFWSTIIGWHSTFTINSLSHVFGTRRYETTDTSRNNFLLALLTLGEGWHNNHHHYAASARNGFRWYEIDLTYYILWTLSKVGLVRDLRQPPRHVVEGTVHPRIQALQSPRADAQEVEEESAATPAIA